eukprot:377932-Rhodomonas_salina.1
MKGALQGETPKTVEVVHLFTVWLPILCQDVARVDVWKNLTVDERPQEPTIPSSEDGEHFEATANYAFPMKAERDLRFRTIALIESCPCLQSGHERVGEIVRKPLRFKKRPFQFFCPRIDTFQNNAHGGRASPVRLPCQQKVKEGRVVLSPTAERCKPRHTQKNE